ncbi:hypothetical protein QFC21_001515 [Naganishia friedmannii]|uniref:Uncharacterized protein n=1 Tax=Naganishia friedmannii TaxID=89922 RepID=A0ACC2W542_9TREE|nr:hypothetical protein QFC21_001515 [Naganishia friedmannii]
MPATARALSNTAARSNASQASTKPLYASQSSIPKLPVPTLSSTFHKYLESIQPHLSPEEFSHSTSLVHNFLDSDLSNTLQARLEGRASEKESWLSEWWNEAAYMGYRDSIVPNVNYFYLHKKGLAKGKNQVERAAELIRGVRDFRDLVVSERLEPEKVKGKPLCTESYKQMFGATRIPTTPADTAVVYPGEQAEHVIVMRKNRFFKLDTKGRSASDLAKALTEIKQKADSQGEALPIGALTADSRDAWTEARRHLLSVSPKNVEAIQAIESSILLVCLDDLASPSLDGSARSWNIYTGGQDNSAAGKARNRWFDKHQWIVDENAETGFNGEHSLLDGTPTLRMNEFVLGALEKGKIELELSSRKTSAPLQPEELVFATDSTVEGHVQTAINNFSKVLAEHELIIAQYDGYGKDAMKAHKTSPDAWLQMTKQLAYGKMHNGQPAVTYESAQTRKFKLGRTEVIRSASNESKAFVQAMLKDGVSDAERAQLLKAAATRHVQYSAWAADAQGVDRHMFGLRKLLRNGEEMPEVFKDPAFSKTSSWTLSTSQLGSDYLDGWGYGEVTPDGWGLSYSIGNEFMRWGIMTKNGRGKELEQNLYWAAKEMKRMMDSAAAASSGGVKAKL